MEKFALFTKIVFKFSTHITFVRFGITKITISSTNGIPYFSVIFKQLDKLVSDEVISFLNQQEHPDNTLIFSIYLEVKDLASFNQHLPSGGDHKLLLPKCYEWFEPSVSCWLSICKGNALQRVSCSQYTERHSRNVRSRSEQLWSYKNHVMEKNSSSIVLRLLM